MRTTGTQEVIKMEIDLFGIKIGGSSEEKNFKKHNVYEITKKQLLEKLGFRLEEVNYISYDYKTKILLIKESKK